MEGDRVMGGVTLYASTEDAFTGLHQEVAQALGSGAALAVANADLAIEAPARIRDGGDINVALGIIAESQGVNIPIARQRLRRPPPEPASPKLKQPERSNASRFDSRVVTGSRPPQPTAGQNRLGVGTDRRTLTGQAVGRMMEPCDMDANRGFTVPTRLPCQ
jgi:hypothetical protein